LRKTNELKFICKRARHVTNVSGRNLAAATNNARTICQPPSHMRCIGVRRDIRPRLKRINQGFWGLAAMSEAKKRKVHTSEFKAKVGLEAVRGVKTINEIGQEYGVHPVQVGQWKKAIQEHAKTLFEGKRGPKPLAAHREPERLYSEIGKLKVELDWLKKKSGISPS
jgi:transposase-like protein